MSVASRARGARLQAVLATILVSVAALGCEVPSAVRVTVSATRGDAPSALSLFFASADAPFGAPVAVPEAGAPPPLPGVVLVRVPDAAIRLRVAAQASFLDGAVLTALGEVTTVPHAQVALELVLAGDSPGADLAVASADLADVIYDFSGVAPLDLAGPPRCTDRVRDQDETDVDCGGTVCLKCSDGLACVSNSDCQSKTCQNKLCVNLPCGSFTCGKNESCSFSQACTCGAMMPFIGKACDSGTICCADACVDTSTDGSNCGGCGIVCDSGLWCSAGKCICTSTSCLSGCCETTVFGPRCLGISFSHCAAPSATCVACSLQASDSCSAAGECVCAATGASCAGTLHCTSAGCVP